MRKRGIEMIQMHRKRCACDLRNLQDQKQQLAINNIVLILYVSVNYFLEINYAWDE